MISIGVVIGTFGDPSWRDLALKRAVRSVERQTRKADSFDVVHGASLAEARNRGAAHVKTDWLVFVDADDELDAGYLAAMEVAIEQQMFSSERPHWLFQPATLGVYENGTEDAEPVLIPEDASILKRNHLVIGTAVERDLFFAVGGFREWPVLEDWDVWVRCYLEGARSVPVADAVYRVHVRPKSRNQDQRKHADTYAAIRALHMSAARQMGLA